MLLDNITKLQSKLENLDVTVNLISYPIIDDVKWNSLLANVGAELPETLKVIYTKEAGEIQFKWFASPDTFGEKCKRGFLHLLSPDAVISARSEMLAMVQEGNNSSELEINEGLRALVEDWSQWVPLFKFPNGDAFCLDIRNSSIVFLEHDVMDGGPYIHGTKVAEDFNDLLIIWGQIAFVDFYDWSQCVGSNGINIESNDFSCLRQALD